MMGAWSVGPFDNDEAMDWLNTLVGADGYDACVTGLRADADGEVTIAAAECLAAGVGRPRHDLPAEVREWAGRLDDEPTGELLATAADRVAIVTAPGTNLADEWTETDDGAAWASEITDLIDRLNG